MRLTLFWRAILAQSVLIALVLIVSLYAYTRLQWLTHLNAGILNVDSACIDEEKRLIKTFLAEMRNAEKYMLTQDNAFQAGYLQANTDFTGALDQIATMIDTDRERELARQVKDLHDRYGQALERAGAGDGSSWEQTKEEISDGILQGANELFQFRERIVAAKTVQARDHAASAARVMLWLSGAGIAGALLLAFLHARAVSSPLKRLAREMRRVGKGEFSRSAECHGPREVRELAQTFNRMTEELEELDKLKADFTAHVSHELRTPLTAIREGTAILLEEIPGPLRTPQREILEVVRSHSDRLFQSISSILDLSKMEAEMMEYEMMACDVTVLIRRSLETVSLIARKKRILIEEDLTDPIPLLLFDERRIQQVLDNLLSNALKFTPEDGRIRVSARVTHDANGKEPQVEVRVSDTGAGIPEEEIEKVFTRFYQSRHSGGKRQQGTGLGLAICRHILEAHHGKIWAESRPGEGSTLVFTLPVPRDSMPGDSTPSAAQNG